MMGRERGCMANRQNPEGRGRAHSSRRKRRLAVAACGAAVFALLASRGQKEPAKTFDFKDIEEYKIDTSSEFPHSMELIYLAPYDADREELYAHMQQAVGSLREEVPDLFSASIEYYEAPLLYEAGDTPIAYGRWGPRGSLTGASSGIQPGDYSRHTFIFQVYPYDADYALTPEEWALYQEVLEYFLYEKGCPPYYINPGIPSKHPDWEEEYRRLAERLGCSYEILSGLPYKVFCWRPSTIESLTEDGD